MSAKPSKEGEEAPSKEGEEAPEEELDGANPELDDPSATLILPPLTGCRSVDNYQKLNRVEEGTYGVVCILIQFRLESEMLQCWM